MVSFIQLLKRLFFRRRKPIKLGFYGPPNTGKTTLVNRICKEWVGEELGKVSNVPHETREVQFKDSVVIDFGNKKLTFKIVDTPGITTKVDYEDFLHYGLSTKEAKKRAKEATKGVIEAIKWLDDVDAVVVVLDSTKNPYTQANITILGNLAARKIPVLIAANKIDLKKANVKKISGAFPEYKVVGISAKYGHNMDEFYEALLNLVK
ncbi:MAG TPA: GTP-binding protein [Candidatus Pacearchaeota archaeon]|nr:GTP-binding protein [Candidatus Pacearchaeota archaeon]